MPKGGATDRPSRNGAEGPNGPREGINGVATGEQTRVNSSRAPKDRQSLCVVQSIFSAKNPERCGSGFDSLR